MSQNKFSNHIMLIGMILIMFNTFTMLLNVGFEIVVLIVTIVFSFMKTLWFALSNYPLTILSCSFLYMLQKQRSQTPKRRGIVYVLLLKVFGEGQQCSICLQHQVDKILLQCGHFYHSKCVDPWIKKNQNCPFCRVYVPKGPVKYGLQNLFRTLKHIFRTKRIKFISIIIVTFLIGFAYNHWWSNLQFFSTDHSVDPTIFTKDQFSSLGPLDHFIISIKNDQMKKIA